jgi:hypothetical protein
MLPYSVDPRWYETYWYADPTGRAGVPHPAVAVGLLLASALLIGSLAALGQHA